MAGGKIDRIEPEIAIASDGEVKEIDAAGLTLLPGVIDPQVHFREPGLEYKEDLFTASYACCDFSGFRALSSRGSQEFIDQMRLESL